MKRKKTMEENEVKNVVNNFAAGSNCQVFNAPISGCVFAMPGSSVTQVAGKAEEGSKEESPTLTTELLLVCVAQVREYFWSESSMAVIFCVCRDNYGYANNMSQFEREFDCQEGLLSNTFRNNPYMRLPVGKWKQNGVKERVLKLVDAYKKAVEERLKK